MKNAQYIIIILLLISTFSYSQEFEIKNPDVKKLKEQIISDYSKSTIYLYLENNFKSTSDKYELSYHDYDNKTICSFDQDFNEIKYTFWNCKEDAGISETISFPKVKIDNLRKWIESIYSVEESGYGQNIWKENGTKYEPKELVPGCFLK